MPPLFKHVFPIARGGTSVGQPFGEVVFFGAAFEAAFVIVKKVLSDGFELVSAWTVFLPFNPHKVGATQRELQHGLT